MRVYIVYEIGHEDSGTIQEIVLVTTSWYKAVDKMKENEYAFDISAYDVEEDENLEAFGPPGMMGG